MPRPDADRNLLFGFFALQMNFITRDALINAMSAWVLAKHRPIGEILVEQLALTESHRAMLEPLVDENIRLNGGDPAASLAALSSVESVAEDLRRSVEDPDVRESLAFVPPAWAEDPYATRSDFDPGPPPAGLRYRKVREHAEGGLGVVFVARDEELNRNVALKEIQHRHADHPHHRARFLLEAEVTGGLEHPGIVPVYGLGHYEDGRPFYAMRFVRGDNLLDAITDFHADPTLKDDPGRRNLALQKLLRRFTDVCNAIAYAHSRGVLHRDLKPKNIMIGKYGETLVVDWGLAKILGRSSHEGDGSADETLRPSSSGDSQQTQPGDFVGTPAYASPEQAAGRLDQLGPATDIYGLGATLYHLLTGRAPFDRQPRVDLLRKVETGDFPRPRTLATWLDPALEAICLKAMASDPGARYSNPRALADDVERWIAGEPVDAYPEPWTKKARRWAKRHHTGLSAAASMLAVAALLLGGFAGLRLVETRRNDAAGRSIFAGAQGLAIEARTAEDLARWDLAIAEALRAKERLETGGSSDLRLEVAAQLEGFQTERARLKEILAAKEKDRHLLASFEDARLQSAFIRDGDFDRKARCDAYRVAFRDYGIDIDHLSVEDAAARIRLSRVADDLIGALDDWGRFDVNETNVARLASISRAAEKDPSRASIREMFFRRDTESLRRLCETEESRRKLGTRVRQVFDSLRALDSSGSFHLLEAILREHPSDLWLNHDFAYVCRKLKPSDAVRYLSVAVALQPESPIIHSNLGAVLSEAGRHAEAEAEHREAIRLNPDYFDSHFNLGLDLKDQGRASEAEAEFRVAISLKNDSPMAHFEVGNSLRNRGSISEAEAEYRKVIRLSPDFPVAHAYLGNLLRDRSSIAEAEAEYREAIRLNPDDFHTHNNLGLIFSDQERYPEAEVEFRKAIHISPAYFEARSNLGISLNLQGKFGEAEGELREAIRLSPDYPEAHLGLGSSLRDQGQFVESLKNFERGHEIGSRRPGWRFRSGELVLRARRLVELETKAIAILRREDTPSDASERCALADVCYKTKRLAASTRFWSEAFAERPALANDMAKRNRYNAACSASLAGSGSGRDEPMPDEPARAKLREQALTWLRADLVAWGKVLDGGNEPARKQAVVGTLSHWKGDADLAGIRDEAGLAKLPEGEREGFRSFWADVDMLLVRAKSGP